MKRLLMALAAVALTTLACDTASEKETTVSASPSVAVEISSSDLQGKWHLVDGTTRNGAINPLADNQFTLEFTTSRRVDGVLLCNLYTARARRDGDQIEFDRLSTSKVGCPQDDEVAFAHGLEDADRISVDDDTLVLTGSATELTFTRLEAADSR